MKNTALVFYILLACLQVHAQNSFARMYTMTKSNSALNGDHAIAVYDFNTFMLVVGIDQDPVIGTRSYVLKLASNGDSLTCHWYNATIHQTRFRNDSLNLFGTESDSLGTHICLIKANIYTLDAKKYSFSYIPDYNNEQFADIAYWNNGYIVGTWHSTLTGYASSIYFFDEKFNEVYHIPSDTFNQLKIKRIIELPSQRYPFAFFGTAYYSRYSEKLGLVLLTRSDTTLKRVEADSNFIVNSLNDAVYQDANDLTVCGSKSYAMNGGNGVKTFFAQIDSMGTITHLHSYNPFNGMYENPEGLFPIYHDTGLNGFIIYGSLACHVLTPLNAVSTVKAGFIRTDVSGNPIWSNAFDLGYSSYLNNSGWYEGTNQRFYQVIEANDKGYLGVGGKEFPADPSHTLRGFRTIVIKTDSSGNVGDISSSGISIVNQKETISIFPNPSHGNFHIQGISTKTNWTIFDVTGRKLQSGIGQTVQCNENLHGMFILVVQHENGLYFTQRICIE